MIDPESAQYEGRTNLVSIDASQPGKIQLPKWYVLDAEKIKTIEDVVKILVGLNIAVSDSSPSFGVLSPYLKEK